MVAVEGGYRGAAQAVESKELLYDGRVTSFIKISKNLLIMAAVWHVMEVSQGGERRVVSTRSSASAEHRICAGWRLSCIRTRSRSELAAGMFPVAEH